MPTYQTNKPLWAFVTTLYLLCRFSYVPTLVHTPTSPCWCSNHYLKEPSDVTTKALGHWQVLQPQWNFSRPTALEERHTLFLASLKLHLQTEYLATHIFQLTNMKGSGWALHSWPSTSKGATQICHSWTADYPMSVHLNIYFKGTHCAAQQFSLAYKNEIALQCLMHIYSFTELYFWNAFLIP